MQVREAGAPRHPRWTDFPIALWVASLLFDFGSIAPVGSGNLFVRAAFYNMAAGCLLALVAALTGALDYNRIPHDSPARRLGLLHGGINVAAFLVFGVDVILRAQTLDAQHTPLLQVILSAVGVALVGVSGWLGGRMVYELGVGVSALAPGRRQRPVT
jgi:uncharacterized membrane protein